MQEHENALKFFQRALQLDPTFTYAYTLAGHEYFANEDFEKGLQCYRQAMRLDCRHYNAWWALLSPFNMPDLPRTCLAFKLWLHLEASS